MSKGYRESIKVLIIQLQNGLLVLNTVLYEAIFVLYKCDWIQEGLHFVVIITCHNILTLFGVFSCLSINGVCDVTGCGLGSRTCRRSNSTEERVSRLVGWRARGGALLLLTRLRHLWFQTSSQGFLMLFKDLFGMIRALSWRSPHLTWVFSCSSLGARCATHSLRRSFLTFLIHKALHHFKFFFHLLVFCFEHLRGAHSKKYNSRINNLL